MFKKDKRAENSLQQILNTPDSSLLEIFSDKDAECHNLMELDNPLGRCFNALSDCVRSSAEYELVPYKPDRLSMVSAFLSGEPLAMDGKLVADTGAIPVEIKQGIKKGIYHVADSKQINGNFRAAIVDKKGKIVKQITLKRAVCTEQLAGNVAALALQAAMKQITTMLQCIDTDIQYLISFQRRGHLQTPYFDSIQKILDAQAATSKEEMNSDIRDAISYLEHGLSDLYGDLSDNVQKLSKGMNLPVVTQRTINYIGEDMVFIPQYVGLLAYLFHIQGKQQRVDSIINQYKAQLKKFTQYKIPNKGLTATELLHSYARYNSENMNFWKNQMPMIEQEMQALPNFSKRAEEVYIIEEAATDA